MRISHLRWRPRTSWPRREKPASQVPYGEKRDWLFILIGDGDNSLAEDILKDFKDIERFGSNSSAHIVGYLDVGKQIKGFEGAKLFYIKHPSSEGKTLSSPVIKDFGQVNTADPKFLGDLITQVAQEFPAKHIAVIISDHGNGWRGAIEDYSHDSSMSLKDIEQTFKIVTSKLGRKIDLIGWDACIMSMGEVMVALSPYAKVMVASEDYERLDGWDYKRKLQAALRKKPSGKGRFLQGLKDFADTHVFRFFKGKEKGLAKFIVRKESNNPTLTAVNLEKIAYFKSALDRFARALIKAHIPVEKLYEIVKQTKSFGGNYRDLYDFAQRIIDDPEIENRELKRAAEKLEYAIDKVVIAIKEEGLEDGAHGIGIFLPEDPRDLDEEYFSLALVKDTAWGEWLKSFYKEVYDKGLFLS